MNMAARALTSALVILVSMFLGFSVAAVEPLGVEYPCTVETSVWMVANLLPDPGDFYQLRLGYQLDERNALFLNGITWKYRAPIGIPMYDPQFESPDVKYPGYVRAFGLGVGYQRFVWRGAFASMFAIPFAQNFHTNDDQLIQSGFQLYLQAQLGYQFDLWKGRMSIKPAIYANYWPVNTNFPDTFEQKEAGWPNFSFEPHLNIAIHF